MIGYGIEKTCNTRYTLHQESPSHRWVRQSFTGGSVRLRHGIGRDGEEGDHYVRAVQEGIQGMEPAHNPHAEMQHGLYQTFRETTS